MATNEILDQAVVSIVPSNGGATSGSPGRLGSMSFVALCDMAAGGNASGYVTADFRMKIWNLSVAGVTDGPSNSPVAVGDMIYYNDGLTPKLSKTTAGYPFGIALQTVTTGTTATIKVIKLPPGVATLANSSISAAILGVTAGTVSPILAVVPDANKVIDHLGFAAATLAAAGTNAATGGVIAADTTFVTAADGTKGVTLPAAVAGTRLKVINTVATQGLPVYPQAGTTINALSTSAAFIVGPGSTVEFLATSATQWYAACTQDNVGIMTFRKNVTTAGVNSGTVIVPAVAGHTFTATRATVACRGGAGTGLTLLQLQNTTTTGNLILSVPQAALTQDTACGPWAASATAPYLAQPGASGEGVQIAKTGGSLATATSVDVIVEGYYI